jgi:ankyrin repeat protein
MPQMDTFNAVAETPTELGWQLLDQLGDSFADMAAVEDLLARGARIDVRNKHGQQVLSLAAYHGHAEAVKLLIAAGAPVDHADNSGTTALMNAVSGRQHDIVKILIEAKANVNLASRRGFTALMWAVGDGDRQVADMLLEAGANVAHTNVYGQTAIDILTEKNPSEQNPLLILLREKRAEHDAWLKGGMPLSGSVKIAPRLNLKKPQNP